MSLLSDVTITQLGREGMIRPFHDSSISQMPNGTKIPSYGTSSYGYDLRLGRNFKVFKEINMSRPVYDRRIGGGVVTEQHPGLRGTRAFTYKTAAGEILSLDVQEAPRDAVIDPCNFDPTLVQEVKDADWLIMPPMSFVLGVSQEYIKMPSNVTGVCLGKSTWARCGMHPLTTPLESGWEGYVTFEFVNLTGLPVKLTAGAGVVQVLFVDGDQPCKVSYADRNGKYQRQEGVAVLPR